MSGLGKLIAMQKAKEQGVKVSEDDTSSAAVRTEDAVESTAVVNHGEAGAGSVPSDDSAADAIGEAPVETPKRSAIAGKLNLLGRAGSGGSAGAKDSQPDPAEGVRKSTVAESGDSGDGPVEFSLDDLAGFDESTAPAIDRHGDENGSGYLDEIEATAPDRDLAEELTAQQLSFVESLDSIYLVLNDPEMFGQSVRIIMMELQENPEYTKLIADQDVHTMIRAMRNTMGLARVKKQEKSRKTTGAARAKKSKVDDKTMGILDSLLAGDGDD